MNLLSLNTDVLRIIIKFLDCSSEIYLVNKFFNKEYKCRKVKLNFFNICTYHINIDVLEADKTLSNYKEGRTIHFNNSNQLEISKSFLNNFGKVSHFCCRNTGAMFFCKKCDDNFCKCLVFNIYQ